MSRQNFRSMKNLYNNIKFLLVQTFKYIGKIIFQAFTTMATNFYSFNKSTKE